MERLIFYVKDKLVVKGYIFDMEITVGKIKYNIKCFLDTGNELREPVTNLPCIIVEENYLDFNKFDEKEAFFINYNAVGYKGTLKGFKVDNLVLKKDKKEWKTITAIVCPCKEVLSKEREFNALLSRGVI